MTIIFHDLPSKTANAWNPATWKTRYTLNYKGLPFETEWVQYVDIEKMCQTKGIPPTFPDGPLKYALPSIFDTALGIGVSDSYLIAEYLDKTYPNTPRAIPSGTEALQMAWIKAIGPKFRTLWPFTVPASLDLIDHPESKDYFYKSRSKYFGKDLHEMRPQGEAWEAAMKDIEKEFDVVDQWILKSGGPYVMGETISFADFAVGGWIKWMQVAVGKDSKEWQLVGTWNNGRWHDRLERLAKYE